MNGNLLLQNQHQHQHLLQHQLLLKLKNPGLINFGKDDLQKEINKRQTQNLVLREVVN
jgi:hypothetical protein